MPIQEIGLQPLDPQNLLKRKCSCTLHTLWFQHDSLSVTRCFDLSSCFWFKKGLREGRRTGESSVLSHRTTLESDWWLHCMCPSCLTSCVTFHLRSLFFFYSPDGKRFRSRKEIARYLEKQGRSVDVGLFDFRRVDFTRDPCKRRERHTHVPEKKVKRDHHLQSAVTVVVNDKVSQQKLQNTFMVTVPLQQPNGVVQLPVIVAGVAEPGANNCNNNNGLKLLPPPALLRSATSNGVTSESCTKSPTSLGNIVQKLWERQLKKPEELERKHQVQLQTPQGLQGLKQPLNMPFNAQSTGSGAQSNSTLSSQSVASSAARPLIMPRLQTPVTTAVGGLCMPALKPLSTCVSTTVQTAPTPTSWLQQQLVSVPTLSKAAPRPAPLPLSVSSRPVSTNAETSQLQTSPVLFRPQPLMQPLSPQNGHQVFSAGSPFSLPYHPALLNYMMMPKSPAAIPILMTPPATPPRLSNFVSFATPNQVTTIPSNFKLSRLPFVTSAI